MKRIPLSIAPLAFILLSSCDKAAHVTVEAEQEFSAARKAPSKPHIEAALLALRETDRAIDFNPDTDLAGAKRMFNSATDQIDRIDVASCPKDFRDAWFSMVSKSREASNYLLSGPNSINDFQGQQQRNDFAMRLLSLIQEMKNQRQEVIAIAREYDVY